MFTWSSLPKSNLIHTIKGLLGGTVHTTFCAEVYSDISPLQLVWTCASKVIVLPRSQPHFCLPRQAGWACPHGSGGSHQATSQTRRCPRPGPIHVAPSLILPGLVSPRFSDDLPGEYLGSCFWWASGKGRWLSQACPPTELQALPRKERWPCLAT